jgi:hypothetical protein
MSSAIIVASRYVIPSLDQTDEVFGTHRSWSIFGILSKPPHVRTDGRAPTLEAAKADLEASWRQWLAWAQLSERTSSR